MWFRTFDKAMVKGEYLMVTHNFKDSKKVGDIGEANLDKYFGEKFQIEEVDLKMQKLGWDRLFTHESGARASVEYKTDTMAHTTGNIFVEVWSNKEGKKRGWAYTSTAQWLYYYLPKTQTVYVIDMVTLKMTLPLWEDKFPKKGARNRAGPDKFYSSEGVCVPIKAFEEVCYEVIKL